MYIELLQVFITETEPALKSLKENVQAGNLEEASRNAHFIKGSAGNLRVEEIYTVAKEIEFSAKEKKDPGTIAESVTKLEALFEDFKKIIPPAG
jgi:HPt (histidine-containing phosphotransfer) domain-containing protein